MGQPSTPVIIAVLGLMSAIGLGSCASSGAAQPADQPITIEEIAGSEIRRLTLSESAADRLDIQTATVESTSDGMVVPSAAVIIDPAGVYWVYTNPEPLVYIREEIQPVRETGGNAFFGAGPGIGMAVVTVGVPELYGAEFGIGK